MSELNNRIYSLLYDINFFVKRKHEAFLRANDLSDIPLPNEIMDKITKLHSFCKEMSITKARASEDYYLYQPLIGFRIYIHNYNFKFEAQDNNGDWHFYLENACVFNLRVNDMEELKNAKFSKHLMPLVEKIYEYVRKSNEIKRDIEEFEKQARAEKMSNLFAALI